MSFFDEIKDWKRFEDLILVIFRDNGWEITYKPSVGADRGRDLICYRSIDSLLVQKKIKMLIQCKFHRSKAVNEKEVGSILEVASSYGVDAYLLATSTKLTSNLQDLFERLSNRNSISFNSLIGVEIEDLVRRNEAIFKEFFPKQYSKHIRSPEAFNEYNLSKLIKQIFAKKASDPDIEKLMLLKYRYAITTLKTYRNIWEDIELKNNLNRIYQKLLKRNVDLVGWLQFGYMIKRQRYTFAQIEEIIQGSSEFLHLQKQIKLDFSRVPEFSVTFDNADADFLGWWTYHSKDYNGSISVIKQSKNKKIAKITPDINHRKFRIAFPIPRIGVKKNTFKIRFRTQKYFELFTLVIGEDHKYYYLGYIPKSKGRQKWTAPEAKYALSYITNKYSDGKWHTFKRSLRSLMKSRYDLQYKSIEYFCFYCTGELEIDYIEIF